MRRILITGVNGFIGNALFNALAKEHMVYGVSRSKTRLPNCSTLDMTDKQKVVEYFETNQFDTIVHLATVLANADNKNDIHPFFQNLKIQTNLVQSITSSQSSPHLINFSSSAVYPNISGLYSENDIIDPSVNNDGLYGLAKFNSEMLFKHLLPAGIRQLHLRVGFVYGKGMNPTRIHAQFKEELLRNNLITLFGNGKRTIPQIKIDSLVEKIQLFISREIVGTLNVADENISLEQLARNIISKYGNAESRIVLVEKGNQHQFGLNLNKLSKLLNV